jgi:hypothetical protein
VTESRCGAWESVEEFGRAILANPEVISTDV